MSESEKKNDDLGCFETVIYALMGFALIGACIRLSSAERRLDKLEAQSLQKPKESQ